MDGEGAAHQAGPSYGPIGIAELQEMRGRLATWIQVERWSELQAQLQRLCDTPRWSNEQRRYVQRMMYDGFEHALDLFFYERVRHPEYVPFKHGDASQKHDPLLLTDALAALLAQTGSSSNPPTLLQERTKSPDAAAQENVASFTRSRLRRRLRNREASSVES